jgi:hypothetical protein
VDGTVFSFVIKNWESYKYPYVYNETFLECRVDGTVFSIVIKNWKLYKYPYVYKETFLECRVDGTVIYIFIKNLKFYKILASTRRSSWSVGWAGLCFTLL